MRSVSQRRDGRRDFDPGAIQISLSIIAIFISVHFSKAGTLPEIRNIDRPFISREDLGELKRQRKEEAGRASHLKLKCVRPDRDHSGLTSEDRGTSRTNG